MAQEATERYLLLRQVYQLAFHNLDITEPNMEELLSLGWVFLWNWSRYRWNLFTISSSRYLFAAPGRDAKGRRVIIAKPGTSLLYMHRIL